MANVGSFSALQNAAGRATLDEQQRGHSQPFGLGEQARDGSVRLRSYRKVIDSKANTGADQVKLGKDERRAYNSGFLARAGKRREKEQVDTD